MTIRSVSKFTPEVLLGSPRRSPGVSNKDGSLILYSQKTYSFENQEQSSELRIFNSEKETDILVDDSSKISNPVWIDDSSIILLRSTEKEATEFVVGDPFDFKNSQYVAGTIHAPADNLKITKLEDGTYGVAVSALANPDGSMYSPQSPKPRSTGRLYRSLFVRHWDRWVAPQRYAIWYGALSKTKENSDHAEHSAYTLSTLVNCLAGTALSCPMPPFGGTDNFDISKNGIIFVSKDPDLDPAINTKCNVYLVPLKTFRETSPHVQQIRLRGVEGAMTSPMFSPDGSRAAFLAMKQNGYETDKNDVFVILDVKFPNLVKHMFDRGDGTGRWHLTPTIVAFSDDGRTIYLVAEHYGRKRLWSHPLDAPYEALPVPRTSSGSVESIIPLRRKDADWFFVSSTSLVDSSIYSFLSVPHAAHRSISVHPDYQVISSKTSDGATLGLSYSQVEELLTPAAGSNPQTDDWVHSWMIKPSNFSEKQKYPLAILIHGGPQGAWNDAWSTRWNPAVFAEQGYVVVCPNITGSTGYGQDFTDAIQFQWGGLPYQDIVNCFDHIEEHIPWVDTSRAVCLGASYGGYMTLWIQGQDLGRKLKALVTHDGVFTAAAALASDEVYFPHHEFGGPWSQKRKGWFKWDPSLFTDNWATPHLIIHSEKDYRVAISDGLAAFNVLQTQGVESEMLTFPDENHFVLNPENSLVWHETVFNWINKHVGLPLYKEGDDKGIIQDPERPTKAR